MNSEIAKTNIIDRSDRILSICIPTCKRPEIMRELLLSIVSQGVPADIYEICITDNSETDETKQLIDEEFSDVENLYYKKTNCKGFYNSIEALDFGNGKFLKLHNDYSIFLPGALGKMIESIRAEEHDRAQVFFLLGSLEEVSEKEIFSNYNEFMYRISYWATWSSGFSIWREDFERINAEGIIPDTMYPHTSFLHRLTEKKRYVIDNYTYVKNIEPKKKGGYNLIDNFVRIYLTMVDDDLLKKGKITKETYDKIEDGILWFCADWYYKTKEEPGKYTFSFENDEKIICERCGKTGVERYHRYLRKRNSLIGKIKNKVRSYIKSN